MDPDNRSCRARLRARFAAPWAAVRARLQAENGSILIEVMVGAVVLAIATIAILNGIDGAQSVGAKNKARSVESTLAQQDIERMRALPLVALDNLRQTRPINVAGVDYTVVSRTDWVSDQSGVINCADTRAQAEYLKLTSTVTAPATGTRPVTQTGLLTPGVAQLSGSLGTATVKLVNRDGLPLAGVGVNLTGASSQSATTNALGCAVFGYIPVGSYTVTVNGYTKMESDTPATDEMQVYIGRASYDSLQVDRPTTLRANFVAPAGQSAAFATSMVWDTITLKNTNLIGGEKNYVRSAGRSTSVDAPELYPFLDGVGVYAGNCAANDPSAYAPNYFVPTAPRGYAPVLTPGEALRSVSVEMPTLRVRVYRSNTSTNFRSAQIKLTPLDAGCTATYTASASFSSKRPHDFHLAVPFGRYTVCVSNRSNTSSSTARKVTSTQDLRTPIPPQADRTVTMTTASTTGDCLP